MPDPTSTNPYTNASVHKEANPLKGVDIAGSSIWTPGLFIQEALDENYGGSIGAMAALGPAEEVYSVDRRITGRSIVLAGGGALETEEGGGAGGRRAATARRRMPQG